MNKDLSIKIPSDAKQIKANEIENNVQDYQRGLLLGGLYFSQMKKIYVSDGILVGMRDQTWTAQNSNNKTTLEEMKVQNLSSFTSGGFKVTDASIKTIGNNRFLIYSYQKDGMAYYSFFSDFGKNVNNMDGFIRYDTSNQKEADQILNDILKSFKTK